MKRSTFPVVFMVLLTGLVADLPSARADETLHQTSEKLYETAMSRYKAKAWKEAQTLLEDYLKRFGSSEKVPYAYLQLAGCHLRRGNHDAAFETLDEVIKRYYGSRAWLYAYSVKLQYHREIKKDPNAYLDTLEEMIKRCRIVPLDMPTDHPTERYLNSYKWNSQAELTGTWDWDVREVDDLDWVGDLLWASGTAARAERLEGLLAKTFEAREGELTTNWQWLHVQLLARQGKQAEADKQFQAYLNFWNDDPRTAGLWTHKLRHEQWKWDRDQDLAKARAKENKKDYHRPTEEPPQVAAIWKKILDKWLGAGFIRERYYRRIRHMGDRGDFDGFVRHARVYFDTYPDSDQRNQMRDKWVKMAVSRAKDDPNVIVPTLKMLDQVAQKGYVEDAIEQAERRIDLYLAAGRAEDALKLAEQFVSEYWSKDTWYRINQWAKNHDELKKLIPESREKYNVPARSDDSPVAKQLEELKKRLDADQTRHADEIVTELLAKHPKDDHTIAALHVLIEYYYRQVIPESREKWIDRMVAMYPTHPRCQMALEKRISAKRGEQKPADAAKAMDLLGSRFPGAKDGNWYGGRISLCKTLKEWDLRKKLTLERDGPRAKAGDMKAMENISWIEVDRDAQDGRKQLGDWYRQKAKEFKGTRTELRCLREAYKAYVHNYHIDETYFAEAEETLKAIRDLKYDPALRWRLEFALVDFYSKHEKADQAVTELEKLIADRKLVDLSVRMSFRELGEALGKAKKYRVGTQLAGKLEKVCSTPRDGRAIDLMIGEMHYHGGNPAEAARRFLGIIYSSDWPVLMLRYLERAQRSLYKVGGNSYATEMRKLIAKLSRCQDVVPRLLADIGEFYLKRKNSAVLGIRTQLVRSYAASGARDWLDREIAKYKRRNR